MATIDLGKIKQVFRGTYNNATAYVPDDLVVFTDTGITSTYICTTASTGNNPSSGGTAHANWAYLAKGVTDPIPSQSGQSGKFLTTNGSALSFGTVADPRTVSAEVDTSTGSQYYAFTGIDTSIKRFDLIFRSYSNSGGHEIEIQLGNASGYKTSGYNCGCGYWRDTASTKEHITGSFKTSGLAGASYFTTGKFECTKIESRWFCDALLYTTAAGDHVFYTCGYVDISNLNSVRFGGSGGTGDGGAVQLVTYSA